MGAKRGGTAVMSLAACAQYSRAPVMPLEELRQTCAEDDEAWGDLERETQQLQQHRAEHRSAYRHTIAEAQRLVPLFRRAHQASQLALYAGNEGMQQEVERL